MPVRKAEAVWQGNLKDGSGKITFGSGSYEGPYSFKSRFEDTYSYKSRFEEGDSGTNPEELIAAAHAGCFSMALSHGLASAGFEPHHVETVANVKLDKVEGGFAITGVELNTRAEVPGIDEATFQQHAEAAKAGCPVSKALAAIEIKLVAQLVTA